MIKKISAIMATVVLAFTLTITAFGSAQAQHHRHHGHGGGAAAVVGGVALGILAAEAINSERSREGCYRGPRECRWVSGGCWRDEDGERVCRQGHRECYRPVHCD